MTRTQIHLSWKQPDAARRYRTGVSLHSHTNLSEESLGIIPRYTDGVPYLGRSIRQQQQRFLERTGKPLDFSRAYWTPPLAPREAYDLEAAQMMKLGLRPLVSLTDHDDLRAGQQLRLIHGYRHAPVSVEWTIPYGTTFFHLGVHNLPADRANDILADLEAWTANPRVPELGPLLEGLHRHRETLLVLNHPFWDEARIGASEHAQTLGRLMERFGHWFHALELNGLRPWKENHKVAWLAQQTDHPVVAGGDRHGREANSLINLTQAETFAEFAAEIRDGQSVVLFMPQHQEPLRYRVVQTMWDVMRFYPDHPEGRRHWSDRVFFRDDDGVSRPIASFWRGNEPAIVKQFSSAMRLVESRRVRGLLRAALADGERAWL